MDSAVLMLMEPASNMTENLQFAVVHYLRYMGRLGGSTPIQ